MVTEGPAEVLRRRRAECELLEGLLAGVRGGQSRVLVITGEHGRKRIVETRDDLTPQGSTRRTNRSKVLTCFKQVKPR